MVWLQQPQKKASEDIDLEEGTTVEDAMNILLKKYGKEFEKGLFFEGFIGIRKLKPPIFF